MVTGNRPRPSDVVDDGLDDGSRARLASWLCTALAAAVSPDDIRVSVPGGGWSNDTWIVTTGLRGPARVVVRVQPQRQGMFPVYDLGRQIAVLRALECEPRVPTPVVLADDLGGSALGRAAFVMTYTEGRAPSDDRPTFAEAGWLHDADAEDQRHFHRQLLGAMARVHTVDVDAGGLASLRPPPGVSSNVVAVDELERIWRFDRGDRHPAVVDDGFEAVRRSMPDPLHQCLLWGDARPANVLCAAAGFDIVAVLDWELATVGTPEVELTWLAEMNWMRMQGAGLERLPGFLSDDEAAAFYREISGRSLADLGWYRKLAALRVAVLMHRYLRAMVHLGRLPADHALLTETVATRRLRSLTGVG